MTGVHVTSRIVCDHAVKAGTLVVSRSFLYLRRLGGDLSFIIFSPLRVYLLRIKHFTRQLQSDKDTCGWASKSHLGKSSVAGIDPPLHMT